MVPRPWAGDMCGAMGLLRVALNVPRRTESCTSGDSCNTRKAVHGYTGGHSELLWRSPAEHSKGHPVSMSTGCPMYLFMNDVLPGCLFAVVIKCFMTGVNV